MKYIKKTLSLFLAALILITVPVSNVEAQSNIIYQEIIKENITSGAVLERITRFTNDGWYKINVLRVDLSNPNIAVDCLTNKDSFKTLTSVENLANQNGAVAAINSSFFSWMNEGGGYADGPIVESGNIISAVTGYNSNGDHMGSISIDNQNNVLYDFFKTDIKLKTSTGTSIQVGQYNKPSLLNYKDYTIFDRRWGKTSMGVSQTYPDIVEIVVDGGKITGFRMAQPAVEIPENGYVIITRQADAQKIADKFIIGEEIKLSITTTPDWNNFKMSATGGAILLKDGKIPDKFSIVISGKRARTAAGSTKDGKQLILVTVDGRTNMEIGMDQTDMAKLMLELGAYNAINFDGGGSTTMVARHPGENQVSLINNPSDGSQRKVAAGLGIFSIAPPTTLDGLIINTQDKNVFVNTSRDFSVKGYDTYLNPITVDQSQVVWSVSGVQGSFIGSTFYPKSTGNAKIKASIGSISSEINVKVLESPAELKLNTKSEKIPLGGTKSFTVTGKSYDGYTAYINPKDVNWSVKDNSLGTFNGNVFTAKNHGTGYIDASIGKVHAYCAISVASNSSSIIDDFEEPNGSYAASPSNIPGSYALYSEQVHSGSAAGKLVYNFNTTEGTRAAYMVYPDKGLTLNPNSVKLGLWVYNTHENPNWLRAEVYDSKGTKHYVEFTKEMDWVGWKYVEASLQGITSPSKLLKLYVVQVNPVIDSGDIYFDDLTQVVSVYPPIDTKAVPQDTVAVDPANVSAAYQSSSTSFRFAVFGQTAEPKNLLEKLMVTRFTQKVNSSYDAAAIVGNGAHKLTASLKKPYVATNTGYKSLDIKNSRFIQLDTSKPSLRLSNAAQWNWFFNQLNSFKGDNIFIMLSGSIKNFSDSQERKLFEDTLIKTKESAGKNIWVIYKGDSNSSYMENGIRYVSTQGYDIAGLTPAQSSLVKIPIITVNGKNVTYEFKPVAS